MNYLLDTCTFIWLTTNPAMLSPQATGILNDLQNALYFSDVSIWEISLKTKAGKLQFQKPIRIWIPEQRRLFKLIPMPMTEADVYRSEELQDTHRDPFDRLLAAQTIESGMTIISPDAPLSTLGAQRVW